MFVMCTFLSCAHLMLCCHRFSSAFATTQQLRGSVDLVVVCVVDAHTAFAFVVSQPRVWKRQLLFGVALFSITCKQFAVCH